MIDPSRERGATCMAGPVAEQPHPVLGQQRLQREWPARHAGPVRRHPPCVSAGMAFLMTLVFTIPFASCGGPNGPSPPGQAPSASCPANLSVPGVVGGSQAVSYPPPSVTGGTQPVTVTCSPGSGTTFSVGTTTVSCTATDASSRTGQCTFTVTLSAALRLGVTKFLAFGDSFTEGEDGRSLVLRQHFIEPGGTYPFLLQGMLNTEYAAESIQVVNIGMSGEPIDAGRQRLSRELGRVHPQALLLLDGYNDLLGSCKISQGRDANSAPCASAINEVASTYRKMIQAARAQGVSYTFASTLTPSGTYIPGPSIREDRRIASSAITTTNAKLIAVIRSEGATVVDSYTAFAGHESEYIGDDGLHPRGAGFQALADVFFQAIKTTVPSTPAVQ
jgi:lysophospholipase L1-like esterase